MFRRFLPKETNFFDYFEQHAALMVQAAQELALILTQNHQNHAGLASRLKDLEHQADEVTHRCIEALRQTFITPFERDDIYRIITRMDDIIDYIEETGSRVSIYQLTEIQDDAKALSNLLVHATCKLEQAVKGLRSLTDTDQMKTFFQNIYDIESQADGLVMNAIGNLFSQEQDIRTLIKWKEIYEDLENAIDRCQDVANVMEGVILEYG